MPQKKNSTKHKILNFYYRDIYLRELISITVKCVGKKSFENSLRQFTFPLVIVVPRLLSTKMLFLDLSVAFSLIHHSIINSESIHLHLVRHIFNTGWLDVSSDYNEYRSIRISILRQERTTLYKVTLLSNNSVKDGGDIFSEKKNQISSKKTQLTPFVFLKCPHIQHISLQVVAFVHDPKYLDSVDDYWRHLI